MFRAKVALEIHPPVSVDLLPPFEIDVVWRLQGWFDENSCVLVQPPGVSSNLLAMHSVTEIALIAPNRYNGNADRPRGQTRDAKSALKVWVRAGSVGPR